MFRLKSITAGIVTKNIIDSYCQMERIAGDRGLKEFRKTQLRHRLAQGCIMPFDWACIAVGGVLYRVNGQHSLSLLSEENWPLDGLYYTSTLYEGDTLLDAAACWAQYDQPGIVRTVAETYNAYKQEVDDLKDLNIKTITLCASGVPISVKGDFSYHAKGLNRDERMQMVIDDIPAVQFVGSITEPDTSVFLRKPAFVAAMINTYHKDCKAAKRFWDAVRSDNSLSDNLHAKLLRDRLLCPAEWMLKGKLQCQREILYAICVDAWNGWRNDSWCNASKWGQKGIHECI